MNVIVLYDEFAAAARAVEMLGRAANRADETLLWNVKPWRFDVLSLAPLPEESLREAAAAHLIVLAIHTWADVPSPVLSWLEAWAERRQVPEAALAVFDGSGDDTLSIAGTATPGLSEFAHRHGLKFIFGDKTPAEKESAFPTDVLRNRQTASVPATLHVPEHVPSDYYQSWGINE